MNKSRKIILLIIGILIIIGIGVGITYSFMRENVESESTTEVSLNSCAKISMLDSGISISLENTSPMSDNMGLRTNPYEFKIKSSCDVSLNYKIYLAVMSSSTLDASKIKYAIKNDLGEIVTIGKLTEEATNDFNSDELNQIKTSVGGEYTNIYSILNSAILKNFEESFYLYLWVDKDAGNEVQNQTFNVGVMAKGFDNVELTLSDLYAGHNMAGVLKKYASKDETLLLHDTSLANSAEDNNYRYSGSSDAVNNFVCFGSDATTCPNDNLYRIIGIFGNQIKLIKYDYALTNLLGTDGDYKGTYSEGTGNYKGSTNVTTIPAYYYNYVDGSSSTNGWSTSRLNTVNLNTNYLKNIGKTWADKIAETTWKIGGMTSTYGYNSSNIARTAYNYELGLNSIAKTYQAKIGLIYVSDYYYAADPIYWIYQGYNDNDATKDYRAARNNNWMYMGLINWLISPCTDASTYAFVSTGAGYVVYNVVSYYSYAVRPSFYLKPSIILSSGSGTMADPYRIS